MLKHIYIFVLKFPQIRQLLLPLYSQICLINLLQELLILRVCRVLSTWKC